MLLDSKDVSEVRVLFSFNLVSECETLKSFFGKVDDDFVYCSIVSAG